MIPNSCKLNQTNEPYENESGWKLYKVKVLRTLKFSNKQIQA